MLHVAYNLPKTRMESFDISVLFLYSERYNLLKICHSIRNILCRLKYVFSYLNSGLEFVHYTKKNEAPHARRVQTEKG
jgi:hypothetical protein